MRGAAATASTAAFDDLDVIPGVASESQDERAVTQITTLLAAERARLHVLEAERLLELAVKTAEKAEEHRTSANYWLEVAVVGARRLGTER